MDEIIITYSLIKSIYEGSKDYLDVFVPFLLISFSDTQNGCSIDVLREKIITKTGLEIPEYALNSIITRAVRNGYLIRKEKKCYLTEEGNKKISEIISKQKDEKNQITALIEDVKDFIKNKYSRVTEFEEVLIALDSFIKRYQEPLINFFNPKEAKDDELVYKSQLEFYLIEYLKIAKVQKPDVFRILEKIFYGALISVVIKRKNITEINKKFSKIEVFLDTNFMFSIMDLHYPSICKPAKELFSLLKTYKFKLKVFDFTIDEMVRVLRNYSKEANKYFPNIKVDSIYSNLKRKGWTEVDCVRYISNIEKEIYNLGIQIEYTGIDLNKWNIPNNERYLMISQYKPDQNSLGRKHDIYAIEKIREIRKVPQREIENCVAFFLTSDLKLARFNFMELGHKEKVTICEVISDRFLTTLLWLKNPKIVKELPLEMILSTQSEILIDRKIWERFYTNVFKLKDEGRILEEDISTLFYYRQIEQDLALINKPDEITSEFILEKIKESKRKIDEYINLKILEKEKKLEEKYTTKMIEKEEEYLKKIENIKFNLKQKAEKKAKKYSYLIWAIPIIFLVLVGILIKIKILSLAVVSLVFTLFSFFGIKFDIFKLRKKIYNYYFNKTYKKFLDELKLEFEEDNKK